MPTAQNIFDEMSAQEQPAGVQARVTANSIYEEMSGQAAPLVSSGAPSAILPAITGRPREPAPEPQLPEQQGVDSETGAPAWERMLASFYSSPQGKQYVLEKKYGKENTRIQNGYAEFLSPSTKQWTRLDESALTARDAADFVGDIPEITAGILGELGGGALGTSVAGPAGTGPGMVAGAGAGQVVGAGMKRLVQSLIGKTEEFHPAEEFALGAGSQLVGMGIAKGAGKIFKPIDVAPEIKAATRVAESAGVPLTAAQKTGSSVVGGAQALIERLPMANVSEGITRQGVEEFGRFAGEEAVDKFGKDISKREAGTLIQDAFHSRIMSFRGKAKEAYNIVWDEVSTLGKAENKIIPHNIMSVAARIAEEIERGTVKDEGVERFLRSLAQGDIASEGQTLREMSDTRSSILSAGRDITKVFSKGKRYLAMLNEAAEADVAAWGEAYSPRIVGKLKSANDSYRKEMEIIFDKQLGNLVERSEANRVSPESIPGMLFGKDKVTKPKVVRRIVGEDTWKEMQGYAVHDIINKATTKGVGDVEFVSPLKLRKAIANLGKEELDAVFSAPQQEALKNISKIGSLFSGAMMTASANPSGTAQAMIKTNMVKEFLLSIGLGGGAYASTGSVSAAAAVSGMSAGPIFSRILQSNKVVKYLSEGFVDLSPIAKKRIARAARIAVVSIVNSEARKQKLNTNKPSPSLKGL